MTRAPFARLVAGGVGAVALTALLQAQASERVLYVSVFDSSSRAPVTGLGPEGLIVREDGVRREVLRVAPATTPMPVAIIADNSEPAGAAFADMRRALTTFVRAIDGLGPVALVGVADRPTLLRDYTEDQSALQSGINRIFPVPGSGARLLDAIVEVSQGLQRRESERAALVVVTTEHIEFSDRHYTDVLQELRRSGAAMHALVLLNPAGSMATEEARNRASVLDRGPRESGGVRFDVLSSMAFEGRLQELAAILRSQYRVVYARPPALIPPERIEVTAAQAGLEAHGTPARGQTAR